MSALSPHIRVLHAEAEALLGEAESLRLGGHLDAAFVVLAIGSAKCAAANAVAAEQSEIEAKILPASAKAH